MPDGSPCCFFARALRTNLDVSDTQHPYPTPGYTPNGRPPRRPDDLSPWVGGREIVALRRRGKSAPGVSLLGAIDVNC